MSDDVQFRDPIIYPGEPLPRPGRWTVLLVGKKCRRGDHTITAGTIARYAQCGGVECLPCVRDWEELTGIPDDQDDGVYQEREIA